MNTNIKVAVITGGGSGIGQSVARALAETGFHLVIAGRRAEKLTETARQLQDSGSRVVCVPTDVTDPDSVKNLFREIRKTFGRLDLLFNNAGTNAPAVPLEDLTYQQLRTVIDTNLTGPFLCTQEAIRMMKEQQPQGGRIINNGSISAQVPRPHSAPYTATKHAITGLTRSTALDGRAFNISCGQIDIGNAATNMTGRMQTGVLQADGSTATEPTMNVQHVADAVAYMAGLPPEVNVPFITVMANRMPFIGRG